eukprot:TRINITY_DN3312_c0_g1_i3.p1 TRINITY_DN3312_c0_g1~~TRINITY_DN3312_c0_g1_i3.p1  ORF type:complete len:625 (-),score=195.46 TRINITY_DN3312_c0_g1_i3:751-2577(-)
MEDPRKPATPVISTPSSSRRFASISKNGSFMVDGSPLNEDFVIPPAPTPQVLPSPLLTQQEQSFLRKRLEECPTWIVDKLRQEMVRRKEIEDAWVANFVRLERYTEELRVWKKNVVKQLEEQRAKNYDYIIALKQQSEEETAKLKTQLIQREEELKSKDDQIAKLTEQLAHSTTAPSVPNASVVPPHQAAIQLPVVRVQSNQQIIAVKFNPKVVHWLDYPAKSEALLELLMMPDMMLCNAIIDSATTKQLDDLVKPLLHLFESRNRTAHLFQFVIDKEVQKTKTDATLFRSNSLTSRMMTFYTSMGGIPYLSSILRTYISDIVKNNENLEVDPNKTLEGQDPDKNLQKLQEISQQFLDTMLDSLDAIPLQFRELCLFLTQSISRKFPEDPLSGVRNFIFLRYICPAILSPPDEFAIPPMKEEARRTLILISKVIQNTVNGVEFKEPYMRALNSFVKENAARVKQFLQKIGEPASAASRPAIINKTMSGKEAWRVFNSALLEMKNTLLEKLIAQGPRAYVQPLVFKIAPRLAWIVTEISARKGKKNISSHGSQDRRSLDALDIGISPVIRSCRSHHRGERSRKNFPCVGDNFDMFRKSGKHSQISGSLY